MKERPIIFNTEMIRAVLDGRKTQTRRILKPQPKYEENSSLPGHFGTFTKNGWNLDHPAVNGKEKSLIAECPYGQPGDILWVRETFCNSPDGVIYKATEWEHGCNNPDDECVWTPSIHMPRWASRIKLEITNVRVERLMEISEADAEREGVYLKGFRSNTEGIAGYEHRIDFKTLWNSIYGQDSWEKNPWVWFIEFKKI